MTRKDRDYWVNSLGLGLGISDNELADALSAHFNRRRRNHEQGGRGAKRFIDRILRWLPYDETKPPLQSTIVVKASGVNVQSDAFLQTREWRELRYLAIKKHGQKCVCCGRSPPSVSIHVDHIKPRHTHPTLALDMNNLQILCDDCNLGKGAWDQTDWR